MTARARSITCTHSGARRRGSILILALVILFALAALVLTLTRTSLTDSALAANNRSSRQADAIARGAEQYVLALLANYRDELDTLTEADFLQVPVGDGYFWITRPNYDDPDLPDWGLMDESSKINLNTAPYEVLVELEGMSDQIAAAIIDWRDEDDTPEANGAESSDYMGLAESYRAKNAEFEAVEEMLMLKGMTRELFYGNGQASAGRVAFASTYYQTHGLRDFFTCWSRQSNTASDGTRRVDISAANAVQQVTDLISSKLGNGIVQTVPTGNNADLFRLASENGLTTEQFEQIEDYIVAGSNVGRINVNTAPREVLVTLLARVQNLTEADIDALIARRNTNVVTDKPSMAWVYDVLKEKANGLGRYICARGDVYSADITAVGRGGRAFKHVRIVVDASQSTPRIVYRRDLTDQGWPLDPQILESIRSGRTITTGGSRGVR